MKTTELMIGDWVIDSWDHKSRVVAIDEENFYKTYQGSVSVDYLDESGSNGEWVNKIAPIPLTPEILEKNGFKGEVYMTLDLDESSYLEFYGFEHRLRKIWNGVDEWCNHSASRDITFQCQCYYVHEFQHALRLCGLHELADNFRV